MRNGFRKCYLDYLPEYIIGSNSLRWTNLITNASLLSTGEVVYIPFSAEIYATGPCSMLRPLQNSVKVMHLYWVRSAIRDTLLDTFLGKCCNLEGVNSAKETQEVHRECFQRGMRGYENAIFREHICAPISQLSFWHLVQRWNMDYRRIVHWHHGATISEASGVPAVIYRMQ